MYGVIHAALSFASSANADYIHVSLWSLYALRHASSSSSACCKHASIYFILSWADINLLIRSYIFNWLTWCMFRFTFRVVPVLLVPLSLPLSLALSFCLCVRRFRFFNSLNIYLKRSVVASQSFGVVSHGRSICIMSPNRLWRTDSASTQQETQIWHHAESNGELFCILKLPTIWSESASAIVRSFTSLSANVFGLAHVSMFELITHPYVRLWAQGAYRTCKCWTTSGYPIWIENAAINAVGRPFGCAPKKIKFIKNIRIVFGLSKWFIEYTVSK